jgi:hypothetical protein
MADIAIVAGRRSRLGVSLPLIFGLAVYAQVAGHPGAVLNDPDTYWHIAIGRWIIAHRAIMHHDVFSFSMPGAPFSPPEWLAEVFMAWLYNQAGWTALVVVTALCEAVALGMLLRILLGTLAPVHALIAAVLSWGLALPHLLVRPHVLTLPILVVWAAALVSARSEDRAPSFWLVPLVTLWANLHSSYMFGLVLATLLAGEAVLLAPDRRSRLGALRGWGLFGVLCVAAALITPFGFDGLLQPFKLTQMSYSSAVLVEWMSPNFQRFQPLELWIMVVLLGGFSLGWRLPWTRVAIVLLLLHLSLQHIRHAELLGYVAPLLLAPALARQLKTRSEGQSAAWIDRGLAELARPAGAPGIALAGAVLLGISALLLRGGVEREIDSTTPAPALAAVQAHHIEGPVFNDYNFGGFLIFSGIKPFIDGRYFYGDAFIRRCLEASALFSNELPELLNQYGITWTMLNAKTPAVTLLDHLPGWRRLYSDDIAVVHLRENPAAR